MTPLFASNYSKNSLFFCFLRFLTFRTLNPFLLSLSLSLPLAFYLSWHLILLFTLIQLNFYIFPLPLFLSLILFLTFLDSFFSFSIFFSENLNWGLGQCLSLTFFLLQPFLKPWLSLVAEFIYVFDVTIFCCFSMTLECHKTVRWWSSFSSLV